MKHHDLLFGGLQNRDLLDTPQFHAAVDALTDRWRGDLDDDDNQERLHQRVRQTIDELRAVAGPDKDRVVVFVFDVAGALLGQFVNSLAKITATATIGDA